MTQKPSVLVVDDESGILDTLRILLRNECLRTDIPPDIASP